MSSWNFNSWDIKDSYTYKTTKKAKKILEKTTGIDSKKAKDVLRDAFFNKSGNNYQQDINSKTRRPPGSNNPSYYQENKNNDCSENSNNHNDNGQYSYNYDYKYTQAPNKERIVTPPPKNTEKQKSVYGVNVSPKASNSSQKSIKEEKLDDNMALILKKSAVPFYSVGVFWLICASFFSLYRWYDILIASIVSLLIFWLFSKIFKGEKIYVKIEEPVKETGDAKVDKIIKSGRNFTKQLHEANANIDNDKLSEQILRLEEICTKITSFIENHPSKISSIRKFMNYYVPTTLKLLNCYDKLEEQRIDGENIKSAMKSIEDAMHTIVMAFEHQLDSLFADEAMDISTDISVLEGMLSQEGLLDSDFNK